MSTGHVTRMPCGSRREIGGEEAREAAILSLRIPHRSQPAMLYGRSAGSATALMSRQRPRAMDYQGRANALRSFAITGGNHFLSMGLLTGTSAASEAASLQEFIFLISDI